VSHCIVGIDKVLPRRNIHQIQAVIKLNINSNHDYLATVVALRPNPRSLWSVLPKIGAIA